MRDRLRAIPVFFICLFGMTIGLKFFYLHTVFGREGIARGLGLAPLDAAGSAAVAFQMTSADALQLALVALAVLLVSSLSRQWRMVMITTLSLAALAGFVNFLACRQIGTLLTAEHLGVTWEWLRKYPGALFGFLNLGTPVRLLIAAIGLAALVLSAAVLLSRAARSSVIAGIFWTATAATILAAGVFHLTRPAGSSETVVSTPYWTAAYASLTMSDRINPLGAARRSLPELSARVSSLGLTDHHSLAIDTTRVRPRYVVLISLETAPLALYPITSNASFPTFRMMSERGVTSTHHFASIPRTTEAVYSLVMGQYPVDDVGRIVARRKSGPTFLTALNRSGFNTTYIDSFTRLTGWFTPSVNLWKTIGFSRHVFGTSNDPSFEAMAASEQRSFATAIQEIDSARARGRGSFITIATAIGHYPWPVRRGLRDQSPHAATRSIAQTLDEATGRLIHELEQRGIADSSVIIVTGDHGLRFRAEFSAVNAIPDDPLLTYNVPFILYAPGAVQPASVDWPTSHVDVVPTLASLLGIGTHELLIHGNDMLAPPPNERAVCISSVGLSPYEGLIAADTVFLLNTLTGRISRSRLSGNVSGGEARSFSDSAIRSWLKRAKTVMNETVAYQFAERAPARIQ